MPIHVWSPIRNGHQPKRHCFSRPLVCVCSCRVMPLWSGCGMQSRIAMNFSPNRVHFTLAASCPGCATSICSTITRRPHPWYAVPGAGCATTFGAVARRRTSCLQPFPGRIMSRSTQGRGHWSTPDRILSSAAGLCGDGGVCEGNTATTYQLTEMQLGSKVASTLFAGRDSGMSAMPMPGRVG